MTLQKKINHLRCLYEEHNRLTNTSKDKIADAEYRGVMLGLDMVIDLSESIKEFEADIKKIRGKGSRSWWHV